MSEIVTTKMSSKGHVVIPEEIRKRLGLKTGSKFVILGDKDIIILKAITTPSMNEFDELITKAREQAQKAGLKNSDISIAISRARIRN